MSGMATTTQLAELISAEMGGEQGAFLVRISQDAGLLPKVRRGKWRTMPQLTVEHLADFVMAIAGSRPVGQRNANGARSGVERYATLKPTFPSERQTFREDLIFFLEQYRDKEEVDFNWILFVDDGDKPEVELRFGEADEQIVRNYSDPDVDPSLVREATVIEGDLLAALAELLREDAKVEADA